MLVCLCVSKFPFGTIAPETLATGTLAFGTQASETLATGTQSSYLSRIYHQLYSRGKNCHVEKFQLSMYDNCGEIYGILLQFMPFFLLNLLFIVCFVANCFATIYALCGEKLSLKVHLWRK